MAAGRYNFIVEQGTQHEVTFRYKNTAGLGINLANYRVRMSVKDHITDTEFVYRATSNTTADDETGFLQHFAIGDSQSIPTTSGYFHLTIPTGTTTAFSFGQGVYDLELVDINGVVTRLLEGKFKVKPQVST